ncbi:helix-turn-helix domain-containing protein [Streptomyces sp. NPDC021098]|uniref:AraC-like ligand-binding domain-containing protein n=1 Tax=unclassified Streptomyces TaxID=2593676 RepID=UPI003794EA33
MSLSPKSMKPGAVGGVPHDVDAWRGMLHECFVELDAVPIGDTGNNGGYTGWAHQLDLGFLTLTDVGSDPVRVVRAPRMLSRDQDDFYLLSIAQETSSCLNGNTRSQLRRGDAVLLDSTSPFQLSAEGFAHHLVLMVPRADLGRFVPVSWDRIGRRIDAENPLLRVLRATIEEIRAGSERFGADTLPALGHTVRELMFSVLRSDEGEDHTEVNGILGHQAQLLRMRDFIRRHLDEPSLSAKTVAAAFRVSVRYVEIVFRESGTSPARYIRETRLEEARKTLASPHQRKCPIAAVARSVGIENPTVFARMFRHFYDLTPSEYRKSQ